MKLSETETPLSAGPSPGTAAESDPRERALARERELRAALRRQRSELEQRIATARAAEAHARRQTRRLAALRKISQDLVAVSDLEPLLTQVVDGALELLSANAGGVYLYDAERDGLIWSVSRGDGVVPIGTRLERGEGISGRMLDDPQPVMIEDCRQHAGDESPPGWDRDAALLAVPILWRGDVLGIINLRADRSERPPFDQEEALLLTQLATYAAAAIENAQLHRRARAELRERRQAERTLRASERRFRTLIEELGEGVAVLAPDLTFRLANPAAGQLLGRAHTDLIGRSLTEFIAPRSRDEVVRAEDLIVADAERSRTVPIVRGEGEALVLGFTATPQLDGDGRLESILLLMRDDTDRDRMEQQLRQAQKMEAVGTLTGGIAHDFNNILTAIAGYAELALLDCEEGSDSHAAVRGILDASERGGRLTRQLLAFSRNQTVSPRAVDCNAVIRGLEEMLIRLIGAEITFTLDLEPRLPRLLADPNQLEQLLINLVVNARDALVAAKPSRDDRRIVVKTEITTLFGRDLVEADGVPGPHVRLTVADNGVGMSPEIQRRIFDPFFTTKEMGRGTGLGLATIYGIVRQNRGQIQVTSAPGMGATFVIDWPVVLT